MSTGTLKLTKEQRRRLFDLDPPSITGEGPCPVQKGDVVRLSSKMELRVETVGRRRKGGWVLWYVLVDRRDTARILKRTPRPQDYDAIREGFDSDGYPEPLTDDVIRQAARESAYTSAPSSLSDAGEAVDEMTQNRLTKEADARFAAVKGDEMGRRDLRASLERLKRLARANSGDSSAAAIIASHLEQIERELRERAA